MCLIQIRVFSIWLSLNIYLLVVGLHVTTKIETLHPCSRQILVNLLQQKCVLSITCDSYFHCAFKLLGPLKAVNR